MNKTILQLVKIKISGGISSMITFMRGRAAKDKSFNLGTAFIFAIIIIAFLFMMVFSFGMAMVLGFQMYSKGCMWLFFPLAFIATTVFSLVGTVFAAQSYLFDSKDNDLLLSMPIKPSYVLVSRMMALYVLNFLYVNMIYLPVGLAYAFFFKFNAVTFLYYFISVFLIPLLATSLSCVFGYMTGKISQKIPNKNMLSVIFGFAVIGLLTLIIINFGDMLSVLMTDIDFLALEVRKYCAVFYWYGLATCGKMTWGYFPMTLFTVSFTYLVYIFLSGKFMEIITRKVSQKKKVYVEKPMKKQNLQWALIKKEVGYFFSIPAYVMNAGMSTIMSIMLGVGILLRGNQAVEMLPQLFPDASSNLIALVIGSSLALCCTINDVTAPSISLEAKTMWLLKSTPVKPMNIFFAKALLAPIVSLPGVIFTAAASAVMLDLTAADITFIVVIPVLACLFSGFLGICVNLKIPRFDWSTEITVIKQSMSVVFSLFLSMFFTAIPFVLAIVPAAYLEDYSSLWSYGLCIIYFVWLVALEVFFLATDGKKIWNSFS